MSDQGKGSAVRPSAVTKNTWRENFERTFGKPIEKGLHHASHRSVVDEGNVGEICDGWVDSAASTGPEGAAQPTG